MVYWPDEEENKKNETIRISCRPSTKKKYYEVYYKLKAQGKIRTHEDLILKAIELLEKHEIRSYPIAV